MYIEQPKVESGFFSSECYSYIYCVPHSSAIAYFIIELLMTQRKPKIINLVKKKRSKVLNFMNTKEKIFFENRNTFDLRCSCCVKDREKGL